jgi:hypothetical protein
MLSHLAKSQNTQRSIAIAAAPCGLDRGKGSDIGATSFARLPEGKPGNLEVAS